MGIILNHYKDPFATMTFRGDDLLAIGYRECNLAGGFKYVVFLPLPGEMIQF